jgi:hypothetical protein
MRPAPPSIGKIRCLAVLIAAVCIPLPAGGAGNGPQGGGLRCGELENVYLGGCCDTTLAACLKRSRPCPIAVHLGAFATWIDTLSPAEPCSIRVAAMAARRAFFTDTTHADIDDGPVSYVGSPASPIAIVLYVSAICPLCKRVYKGLYAEVTTGSLKGIARLGVKVRSTRPWDLALLAARRVDRQSALLLALGEVDERISMAIIRRKAAMVGVSPSVLARLSADSTVLREANRSIAEAEKNGVTVTPTVFIDDRRYRSYKDPQWVADAVLYRYETGTFREPVGAVYHMHGGRR